MPIKLGSATRVRVIRAILRPLWVRVCGPLIAAIGFYDAGISQLVPKSQAEKFPKIYELISMTTGFLPWWGWALILAALFVVATIEYEVHQHKNKTIAAPLTQSQLNDDVRIIFGSGAPFDIFKSRPYTKNHLIPSWD